VTKYLVGLSVVFGIWVMVLGVLLINSNSQAPATKPPHVSLTVTCPGTEIGGWDTGQPPVTNGKG